MKSLRLLPGFLVLAVTAFAAEPAPFKVAVLKIIPRAGDKAGNYAKFEQFAREAAAGGAKLLVTSECYLDGYLGHQKMHPEMTTAKLLTIAEPVDGPHVQRAEALARELGAHIVFGFSERRGDKLFNSAALLTPDGKVAGTYSKAHTGGKVELYEPGGEFPVFATPLGQIGLLICLDRQFPETSRTLAVRGAQLILIPAHSPTVDRINEDVMMRVRAFENNAFVVLANPFNALVANPEGEIIAQNAVRDDEGVLFADVDLTKRAPGRAALEQRRPELYGELTKAK
jgi:predicted amidohydrolase